jgi:hypothetical protein
LKRQRDEGYALLTVVIALLAAVTAVLLPMSQLIQQARTDTSRYISVMKRAAFQRAFYGRVAEQAGGLAMSCGGLFSDHYYEESSQDITTRGFVQTRRHMMTEFFDDRKLLMYANDFVYRPDLGFWSGYRGRRYLYPGPADDWDENQLGFLSDQAINDYVTSYRDGSGIQLEFGGSCITWPKLGSTNDPRNRRPIFTYSGFYFLIEDYDCTPEDRLEMWIMRSSHIGDVVSASFPVRMGFDDSTRGKGYCTHAFFYQNRNVDKRVKSLSIGKAGLHKIGIRVDGRTVYTTSVAVPAGTESNYYYWNDNFVQTIVYGKKHG